MSAHTPGPWRMFRDTKYGPWKSGVGQGNPWFHQWWIDSDSRKLMALLEVPYLATGVDHLQRTVNENAQTVEEVEANARLISAAPELLTALEAALSNCGEMAPEIQQQAREAIDKARGLRL